VPARYKFARGFVLAIVALAIGTLSFARPASAGVALPDGRAWEMVSPLDKNGGDIRGIRGDNGGGVVQAAASGEAVTYVSALSFDEPQGASIGSQYVARRDGGLGWSSQNISTPMSAQSYPPAGGAGTPFRAFSADLASGLVWGGPAGPHGFEGPALAGSPAGYENYYLAETSSGGGLQPVVAHAPSMAFSEFRLEFLGATTDLAHVIFKSRAVLGTGALEVEGGHNLYEWDRTTGQFQAVNILPGGTEEASEVLFGGAGGALDQAISEDGSKVVWTAETSPSTLYVREGIGTPHPTTVQADAPAGNGRFRAASSDDSKIFFTDSLRLTADSTASQGAFGDLYRFEPEGSENSRLVDLTVDPADPGGAEVLGVLGASADGSYLYFVANGVLDADPRASRGNCTAGSSPAGARCNLYLWHEGWSTPRFVARLSGGDELEEAGRAALGAAYDWAPSADVRTARVSRDGNRVVFMSEASLTGYDNTVSTGSGCRREPGVGQTFSAQCQEVFLYEASTNQLRCVSCNPSGARPVGPSGIPGGTQIKNLFALYQSHVLSEGGGGAGGSGARVFFDSADALVRGDSNDVEDVYEYENGNVYLISDGTNVEGASFVDASSNGSDVFFVTRAQLASQDTDQLADLYDARAPHRAGEQVGFPAPPPVVCQDEDCRDPYPGAPVFGSPASAGFAGLGNVLTPSPIVTKPKPHAARRSKRPPRKIRRSKRRRKGTRRGGKGARAGAVRAAPNGGRGQSWHS
jgi:hypothetical protein